MNDAGQVIGIYNTAHLQHPPAAGDPPVAFQSFRWTPGPDAAVQVLQSLAGDDGSEPMAINNLGQVVGESHMLSGTQKAVLWKAGSPIATALPPLVEGGMCIATDINDFGVIAGLCETATGGHHAVLWQPKLHFGF
jgi:probable HAF family extracellular repeat protein